MATSVMWQNHEKCQCLKLSTNQGLSTGTGTGEGGEEY